MTPINIAVPESLTNQKAELEAALAGIATEEEQLIAKRKEIEVTLSVIATGIAVLSGQPLPAKKNASGTVRKPMSEEAKKRIGEGLRKWREAKAQPSLIPVPAPQAPEDAPTAISGPGILPQFVSTASEQVSDADAPRESRRSRKAVKD